MIRIPRILSLLAVLAVHAAPLAAQDAPAGKRALTHDDYDGWRSVQDVQLSADGLWAAFSLVPQVGDAELVVRSTDGAREWRHPRGRGARFTEDGRFVVFRIEPARQDQLEFEREKLRKQKKARSGGTAAAGGGEAPAAGGPRGGRGGRGGRGARAGGGSGGSGAGNGGDEADEAKPLPAAGILNLADGSVRVIERIKSFQVPEEGPAIAAIHLEKPKPEKKKAEETTGGEKEAKSGEEAVEPPLSLPPLEKPETKPAEPAAAAAAKPAEPEEAKKEEGKEKKEEKKDPPKYLADGTPLLIVDLSTGAERRIEGVTSFGVTRKKGIVWWAANSKKDDEKVDRGFFALLSDAAAPMRLVEGAADYKNVATDRDVRRFAFLSSRRDREAEKPTYDLHSWDLVSPEAQVLASNAAEGTGIPAGRTVSPDRGLEFSWDGGVLLFGIRDLPVADDPPILDEEKVTLDLWHWKDPLLQPMQEKQAARTREASIACAWHFDSSRMTIVGASDTESLSFLGPAGTRLLAEDGRAFAQEVSWDGRYVEVDVVNTLDGTRSRVLSRVRGGVDASPDGRWVVWFEDGHWHSLDLMMGRRSNLTAALPVSFAQEEWDTPEPARPWGVAGWTAGDRQVLIHDRYDLWMIDPTGLGAFCVTDGFGRANETRLRLQRLDRDERFVAEGTPQLFSSFDEETMGTGFYSDEVGGLGRPRKLLAMEKKVGRATKAKRADRLIFTIESFSECPDLWAAAPEWNAPVRLSDANPQIAQFRWGRSELVHWNSADGKPLKGVLIKPEDFDPARTYPLMVYFYERMSDDLHNFVAPAPGTSPNASYYVSNGYLWFMPDIAYDEGWPGDSCLKCLIPGVLELVDRGFVDRNAIGAAGHSWGGYQTAWLITRTDLFAAVESGAPVANMTSAYGGIRWSTGMSRAFQYEKTQSRIGGSIWDFPLRFIENSPIFFADRVRTPILMLHNDQDGAVPWYQGIEYFCALRRLGKEAYLANYNGEDHGLRRRANMRDWTMRMQQYFDHHLRGAPAPDWMQSGVPYVEREKEKLRFRPPVESLKAFEQQPAPEALTEAAAPAAETEEKVASVIEK